MDSDFFSGFDPTSGQTATKTETKMSDIDDDMMDDDAGYDLEYSEEDSNSELDYVDLENQYYNSKAIKEENPKGALESFQKVLDLEQEKGEWGFKALKQMIKLNFKLVSH